MHWIPETITSEVQWPATTEKELARIVHRDVYMNRLHARNPGWTLLPVRWSRR